MKKGFALHFFCLALISNFYSFGQSSDKITLEKKEKQSELNLDKKLSEGTIDFLSVDLMLKKYEYDFDMTINKEKQEKLNGVNATLPEIFSKWSVDEKTKYLTSTFLEYNSEMYLFDDFLMGYMGYKKKGTTQKISKNNKNYIILTYFKSLPNKDIDNNTPYVEIHFLDLVGVVIAVGTPENQFQQYMVDKLIFQNLSIDEMNIFIKSLKSNNYTNELEGKSNEIFHFVKKTRDSMQFNDNKTKILKSYFEATLFQNDKIFILGKYK